MNTLPERSELIDVISKIMNAEGSEDELNQLLFELNVVSPLPNVSDLIFYPDEEMSAEEIADAILSYKAKLLAK